MVFRELLSQGVKKLKKAGIASPEVDAFYLFEAASGLDRAAYLMKCEQEAPEKVRETYLGYITRRASHVPYQYILGEAWFYGFKFRVDESVLIPRLDTEILVQEALDIMPEEAKGFNVLDMCTGSGCVGITIKKMKPGADLCLCDISPEALSLAKENAACIAGQESGNIRFILSDLFAEIEDEEWFDLIVSNPPYVSEAEYRDLEPEVKEHEPALALLAGSRGMDIYERLVPAAAEHLNAGCPLVLEIGSGQAREVSSLMRSAGLSDIYVKKDLAGLDRVVCGRKMGNV